MGARSAPIILALDAMGVLYETGDDVAELLVPFARRKGSQITPAEIERAYLAASLGRIDARAFWQRIGLDPGFEDEYLARHRMTSGVRELLAGAASIFDAVCCISNDVGVWSAKLRRRFALDTPISHWFVSGDFGVRKPDAGLYRHAMIGLNARAASFVFVDDRPKNLDTARRLGFRTILFDPENRALGSTHMRIKRLSALLEPATLEKAVPTRLAR